MAPTATPDVIEVEHKSATKDNSAKGEAGGAHSVPEKPLDQPAPEELLQQQSGGAGNKIAGTTTSPPAPTGMTPPQSQHSTIGAGQGAGENPGPKTLLEHHSQKSQSQKSGSAKSSHTQQQHGGGADPKLNVQLAILDNQLRNILKTGREESQASTSLSERERQRQGKPGEGDGTGRCSQPGQTNGPVVEGAEQQAGLEGPLADIVELNGIHPDHDALQERRESDDGVNVNGTLVLDTVQPEVGKEPIQIEDDNDNRMSDMPKISMPDFEHDPGRHVTLGSAIEYNVAPRNGSVAFGTFEERSQTNMYGEYVATSIYVDENATRAAPYTLASQFNVSMGSSEEDSEGDHKWEVMTRPPPSMQSPARDPDKRRSWHIGDDDKPSASSSSEPRRHSVPKYLLGKDPKDEKEKDEQEDKEEREDSEDKTQTQSVGEDYERTGTLKWKKKRKGKGSGKISSPSSPIKVLAFHDHHQIGGSPSHGSYPERGAEGGLPYGGIPRSSSGGFMRDFRPSSSSHSLRTDVLGKRLSQQDLHKLSQQESELSLSSHCRDHNPVHSHIKDSSHSHSHLKDSGSLSRKESLAKVESKLAELGLEDTPPTPPPEEEKNLKKDIDEEVKVLEFQIEGERDGALLKGSSSQVGSDSECTPGPRVPDIKLEERGMADGESPRQIIADEDGADMRDDSSVGKSAVGPTLSHQEQIAKSIEKLAETLSKSGISNVAGGGNRSSTAVDKPLQMAHSTTWPSLYPQTQSTPTSPLHKSSTPPAERSCLAYNTEDHNIQLPLDHDSLAESLSRGSGRLDGSASERELQSMIVGSTQPRVEDNLLRASFDMARLTEQLHQHRPTSPDVLRAPRPPTNPAPHKAARATAAR